MIAFSKAHACGNDFLIVETEHVAHRDLAELTRRLCARTTGVGADGVEYLTRRSATEGSIELRNADGSIAEISGNGTRCVAAWMAYRAGFDAGRCIELQTGAGMRACRLVSRRGMEFHFTTAMGVPVVRNAEVSIDANLAVAGAVVSTGNPHFVVVADDETFSVAGRSWQQIGAAICTHPDFPEQTNVEFVRQLSASSIEIRIYERGVGPTSSSGTGTSAAAAAMMALRSTARRLHVLAPGGEQVVEWGEPDEQLELTGPAEVVVEGSWLSGDER